LKKTTVFALETGKRHLSTWNFKHEQEEADIVFIHDPQLHALMSN